MGYLAFLFWALDRLTEFSSVRYRIGTSQAESGPTAQARQQRQNPLKQLMLSATCTLPLAARPRRAKPQDACLMCGRLRLENDYTEKTNGFRVADLRPGSNLSVRGW